MHQPPGLQLFEPHADIGARERQALGNLIGIDRARGEKDQRIDLPDSAVDSPAAAHFAKMRNKLAGEFRQRSFGRFHGWIIDLFRKC